MRRLIIFIALIIILIAAYKLRQISADWHYVVPAEPGELLYVSSFDGSSDDWEKYTSNETSTQALDGIMRVTVNRITLGADDIIQYSAVSPYFGDFDFSVEARAIEGYFGDNNNAYGVVFRQHDRDNFFVFLISGDGYYRIDRIKDGVSENIFPWGLQSESIDQGLDTVNHLRVVGYEDRFQFYINDTLLLWCTPDDPLHFSTIHPITEECMAGQWQDTLVNDSIPFGRLGVVVNGDIDLGESIIVEFDNVVVFGPQPIGDE